MERNFVEVEVDGIRSESTGVTRKSWTKYVYTLCLFINQLSYGVTCSLFGPTMVDMKHIFNTSMNYISLVNTFGSIGYLTGSLFGFLYVYINRQLSLSLLLVSMSVAIGLFPFCPNILTLYLCSFVAQLGGGAWDNANNVWLIEMWEHKSSAILQFSQFMYGLGCILAPILVKPYLTGVESGNNSSTIMLSTAIMLSTDTLEEDIDRRSKLKLPFVVNGFIQLIIHVILFVMFFINRYKTPKLKRKLSTENLQTDSDCDERYSSQTNLIETNAEQNDKRLLIILIAILLATYSAMEVCHFSYSSTYYQFISLRFSAQKSAEIMSVMATSFTIGRCLSAFIAIKIKPKIIISYHFLILIISMFVLYYGQDSEEYIWFGNVIIGIGFSAMWPSIIALAEQHIKVDNKIGTILVFSCGTVGLFSPFILGPLIENHSYILNEFETAYLIASILLFILILTIVRKSANTDQLFFEENNALIN